MRVASAVNVALLMTKVSRAPDVCVLGREQDLPRK